MLRRFRSAADDDMDNRREDDDNDDGPFLETNARGLVFWDPTINP